MSDTNQSQQDESQFFMTVNFPTPNGGAYSRGYFYDENHQPCTREQAKYINIVEYDENDNRINETYGTYGS